MSASEEKSLWTVPGLGGGLRAAMAVRVNRLNQCWDGVFSPVNGSVVNLISPYCRGMSGVMDGMVAGS